MRNLLLCLLLFIASANLSAQLTGGVVFTLDVPFLGKTDRLLPSGLDRDQEVRLHFSAGYEMIWRRPDKGLSPVFGMQVGVLFGGDLANSFEGRGTQLVGRDEPVPVEGLLYGQAHLVGATTGQINLGGEFRDASGKGRLSYYLGAGLLTVLRERVHATTSWIDPNPEEVFSYAACCGRYEEVDGRIQQTFMEEGGPGAGNLFLSQTMLNRYVPFVEARLQFQAGKNAQGFFGLQVGVLPIMDKSWYNGTVSGGTWIAIRGGTRGLLF